MGSRGPLGGVLCERIAAGSKCLVLYPRPQAKLVEFSSIDGLKVGQFGSGELIEVASCFSARRKLVDEGNPAGAKYDFILIHDIRPMERAAALAIMGAFPEADVLVAGFEAGPVL